jgi:hypothetical protein
MDDEIFLMVYTEFDRVRFETAQEIICFISQILSFGYTAAICLMLFYRPLRHPTMNKLTWGMVITGLGYNITVILYDWVDPFSHLLRCMMLWFGISSVLFSVVQQLEIMKAFALLSTKLRPTQIVYFQICYSIFIGFISIPSLTEDMFITFPSVKSLFGILGNYGRSLQALSSVVITNSCSVYMLRLVYKSVDTKAARKKEKKTIHRNFMETIVNIIVQLLVDIVACTAFVVSALLTSSTPEEERIRLSYSRIGSSVILLRGIFQYLVFLGIMRVKFYKQSGAQSSSKKSKKALKKEKSVTLADPTEGG